MICCLVTWNRFRVKQFHLPSCHDVFLITKSWSKSTLCVNILVSFCLYLQLRRVSPPPKLKVPPFYMEVDHVLQLGKNTCPWFMLYGHCGYWILSVLSTEFFTVPLISHVGIKCGFGFLAVTCSCRKPFFTWYRFCPFKRVFLFSISGSFLWESSVGISRKYRWHMLFAFSLTQLWL